MKNIIYIIKVFYNELIGKIDYWHPEFKARKLKKSLFNLHYYLDFSQKSIYPFRTINKIPVLNFNNKDVFFSITIFNYAIGLIDNFSTRSNNLSTIKLILNWTILNQEDDGSWRNKYEVKVHNMPSGWTSAMGQGLGISFLVRCYNMDLLTKEKADLYIKRAITYMYCDELVSNHDGNLILQEFSGTSESVLNGYIFAIYGLHDYYLFSGDKSYFNKSVKVLLKILPKYNFMYYWSFYSLSKTVTSSFYHKLHIEMMDSLFHLTNHKLFLVQRNKWNNGLKFRIVFIILKSFQKLYMYKTIGRLPT